MNPVEVIYFMIIGFILLLFILFIWIIFKKRKKVVVAISSLLIIGYIGYYLYYPTHKVNVHEKRYGEITKYLTVHYPELAYTIEPKQYEKGYTVGEFRVNSTETETTGVTFQVDNKGQISKTGTWSNSPYPSTQSELWREIEFHTTNNAYTLDQQIPVITKEDEWINGEHTAFALTIDGAPAISLFDYSREGYSLLSLQTEKKGDFVVLEEWAHVFVFVDKDYPGQTITTTLTNGVELTIDVDQKKGRLIVDKMPNS